jgi:hypothetical protein
METLFILMTAATFIMGMLPLVYATGVVPGRTAGRHWEWQYLAVCFPQPC